MIICGLKLTHDGSVAVIDNGKLICSIELEKLNNNKRYSAIENSETIEEILLSQGYSVDQIDFFAVDGWGGYTQDALAVQPRLRIDETFNLISITNNSIPKEVKVAQYEERDLTHDILQGLAFDDMHIGEYKVNYKSFLHVTNHVLSAYCTSPFAKNNESSYVLVWDGGMYPRLYFFDATSRTIENLGPLFLLIGNVYTIFSQHFGPFKTAGSFAKDDLSIAGKVMAYIALGKVREELFQYFEQVYRSDYNLPMGFANVMANEFKKLIKDKEYSDEDILCTFHAFLEQLLIDKLAKKISRYNRSTNNICIAGGCALNIKWNNSIRASSIFRNVYVPPFPNDSGSAIGAACAIMLEKEHRIYLDWDVYSGPLIIKNEPFVGWDKKDCSIKDLASLLHTSNEPVVFLNNKAELGPRALGNRSIIASPVSSEMKGVLNEVKKREAYRPVSPICLENKASGIFSPGNKDPYMLFDHQVKEEWIERIPAIRHLDGSARLQTINEKENKVIAELLNEFEKVSGIPLLCNTSANLNGSGFFPDVYSATKWNEVNYVWCDHTLYFKKEKKLFNTTNN